MMRRIGIVVALAFMLGAAAHAQSLPFLDAAAGGATACQMSAKPSGGPGGPTTQSFCQANCWGGTTVSVTCAGTCSASNESCPSQNGWVSCNGSYTFCSSACPVSCEAKNGTSCSPNGASIDCVIESDHTAGYCSCFGGRWTCTL